MLKSERHDYIRNKIKQEGAISIADMVEALEISDMTARRDLSELEEVGILKRVHGGAIKLESSPRVELSHRDKKVIHMAEKELITDIAIRYIQEDDTVFLGPGTTIELLASKINVENGLFVTNCLPVFNQLRSKHFQTYLIGGEMRAITEAFNGEITLSAIEKLRFNKAFFSCNGIKDNQAMTSTITEGKTQALALDNSLEKYLVVDAAKIDTEDFFTYYDLRDLTAVITNPDPEGKYRKLERYTRVIYQ